MWAGFRWRLGLDQRHGRKPLGVGFAAVFVHAEESNSKYWPARPADQRYCCDKSSPRIGNGEAERHRTVKVGAIQQPQCEAAIADIQNLGGNGGAVATDYFGVNCKLKPEIPPMLGFHLADRRLEVGAQPADVERLF